MWSVSLFCCHHSTEVKFLLFFIANDCFLYMKNGSEFLKIRPGRQYQRFYQLSEDMESLHWKSSSKKPEKAVCKFLF